MIIEFSEVGRDKQRWKAQIKELTHNALYAAVKNNGSILSPGIDFRFDKETQTGRIFVGMFRDVGSFKVLEKT